MTQGMSSGDEQDKLLLDGVCAYEDYMDAHVLACRHLKQGFLKLAMARMRLPAHALTELSYKEEFAASLKVTDHEGDWIIPEHKGVKQEGKAASPTAVSSTRLVHRKKASQSPESALSEKRQATETKDEDGTHQSTSTLLWFSSLPPNDLRDAQKQFVHGLQLLVTAATSVRHVQQSVVALEEDGTMKNDS